MNRRSLVVGALAIVSCAGAPPNPGFVSDIEIKHFSNASSTQLERVISGNKTRDSTLGIAVLVARDQSGARYVAIAPSNDGAGSTKMRNVKHEFTRTLTQSQANDLRMALNLASRDYDRELSELTSINTSFESHLEVDVLTQRQIETLKVGGDTAPKAPRDFFSFTFVNTGGQSVAKAAFGAARTRSITLKKDELEHFADLLKDAISRAGSPKP